VIARHRHNVVVRRLAVLAGRYLARFNNYDFDPETNGEARVLGALGRAGATCVFDVGANTGDWTAEALQAMPAAHVHAFEVVPDLAEALARRFGDHPRVTVNACGMGSEEGEVDVRYVPDAPVLSSLHELPSFPWNQAPAEMRRGRLTTGDAYCAQHGVERIDLLKLDVEGHEMPVLRGFERGLREARVRAVQFEYGHANIFTRTLLLDFHQHLEALGYEVGKVFPREVEFRAYQALHEDFVGPNFLAVRRGDDELRRILVG
jgi:FkbM family methyltransferase